MKIILINPNSTLAVSSRIYSKFVAPILPMGLAYIATVLERGGFEVVVIDQYANKITNEELLERIRIERPQIIGISCLTPMMDNVKMIVNLIRRHNKQIPIVLGNTHATLFSEELLKQNIADIIVHGEGEITFLEVAQALEQSNTLDNVKGISYMEQSVVRHNEPREPLKSLDELPYPSWHLFEFDYYKQIPLLGIYDNVIPVQSSRGCPYQCIFCSQDIIYKKPRYRDIHRVIDEIEYMHDKLKVSHFGFVDPFFPVSIKQGLEFCEEFIKRGLHKKIKWITETRVDLVNLELLMKMKEAGLYLIMYGFEVGNQKVLDSLKKRTTLEQAKKAMEYTKKAGVFSLGLFILGMPEESKQTCKETIRFAKELDCDIAKFNIAIPLPGSKFFEECKNKIGQITSPEKFVSWTDWSGTKGDLIYSPEGMTSEDLINLQRKAMFEFYVRPKLIFRHIFRRTISLDNLCCGAFILVSNYLKIFFSFFFQNKKKINLGTRV